MIMLKDIVLNNGFFNIAMYISRTKFLRDFRFLITFDRFALIHYFQPTK